MDFEDFKKARDRCPPTSRLRVVRLLVSVPKSRASCDTSIPITGCTQVPDAAMARLSNSSGHAKKGDEFHADRMSLMSRPYERRESKTITPSPRF